MTTTEAAFVVREPRTYTPDGPHSFYADVATVDAGLIASDAMERLSQHQREVQYEMEQRSPEGLRAIEELRRTSDPEVRAATSSTIGGFTTPQWLIGQYALYRGIHRSFIDQTNILPIPRYGMTMHVPTLTGPTQVSQTAENTIVAETDSTGSDLDGGFPVVTVAGQFQYSIQLYDRAMEGGGAFDAVIAAQLQQSLDQATDTYALNQAITLGNAVTGQTTWSMGGLFQDLAAGREVLSDGAGVRYRPTHMFTTSDLFGYATRQLDSSNRPILVPSIAPSAIPGKPLNDDDDESRWEGFTGLVMGSLLWFFDDNIPASGANTQILVSRPDTVLSLEGDPSLRVFPQTYGNSLTVVAQLVNYVCVIPRFPNANAVITGAAYPTTLR